MSFSERMKPFMFAILRTLKIEVSLTELMDATPEDDMERGVDLYAFVPDIYIALRVRRATTHTINNNDVTIRSQINNHSYFSSDKHPDTELHKIRQKKFLAKYYFYCVANKEETGIVKWILWDVFKSMQVPGFWDKERISNKWKNYQANKKIDPDGDWFYAIPVKDLREIDVVVAEKGMTDS